MNHQLRDAVLVLDHVAIGADFAGRLHWVRCDKAGMAAHTPVSFLLGHRIIAHGSTCLADGAIKAFHSDLCQPGTLVYIVFDLHHSPAAKIAAQIYTEIEIKSCAKGNNDWESLRCSLASNCCRGLSSAAQLVNRENECLPLFCSAQTNPIKRSDDLEVNQCLRNGLAVYGRHSCGFNGISFL